MYKSELEQTKFQLNRLAKQLPSYKEKIDSAIEAIDKALSHTCDECDHFPCRMGCHK